MEIFAPLHRYIPKIHKDGVVFIIIALIMAFILREIWLPLGWLGFFLAVGCVLFFRDPERVPPLQANVVTSPADGIVTSIETAALPIELGPDRSARTRISILLDVFDVHVNRVPIAGTITGLNYQKGKFINATLDKSSNENERQSIEITTLSGEEIVCVQIAGLVSRRIVCDLKLGQHVKTGERYGIIRFGSRVDVYLPHAIVPEVRIGQTMVAGETVLARIEELITEPILLPFAEEPQKKKRSKSKKYDEEALDV